MIVITESCMNWYKNEKKKIYSFYIKLHSEQIWHSSLTELFFDLLYFSLKEDTSILRIKSFVKRLLQVIYIYNIHPSP